MSRSCRSTESWNSPTLPLTIWDRLSAVGLAVELGTGRGLVGTAHQKLVGTGNVIPAAIGKVDDGLVVPVDGDDAADHAFEAFQLRAVRLDGHVLVGPRTPQGHVLGLFLGV